MKGRIGSLKKHGASNTRTVLNWRGLGGRPTDAGSLGGDASEAGAVGVRVEAPAPQSAWAFASRPPSPSLLQADTVNHPPSLGAGTAPSEGV